ncbi:MAG TPA: 3,4-dihydroxyphenylacetate 2,3-dioxygenase [Ktedonobacteraceae bacterium]|nr:3,4-dihydroxyphenylacetate 2,3-dioxygenase [Ktedonobacteraceae bacterium]
MLDTQWIQPPFTIVRAAHAEYVVTDLAKARAFYVDLLGFVLSEETSDTLYLRGYEERLHHSLVLRQGPAPAVDHIAFRVAAPGDLDLLARFYDAIKCPMRWVREQEIGQAQALRVQDPLGCTVEFFYDMTAVERMLQRFDLYKGTHVLRIDHFNIHVPDVQLAYDYYKRLGFRCSEYTVTDGPDEKLWGAWMYRKPSVHDVALMNGVGPRLHHVAFWMSDTQSILRTCDVLAAAEQGAAIERGPGRHGISNAFFLYLRDPDGHRIELYTSDYFTGDPDFEPIRWSINDPRRATFWGHVAPASWFEQASPILGLDGTMVPTQAALLKERPQTVT